MKAITYSRLWERWLSGSREFIGNNRETNQPFRPRIIITTVAYLVIHYTQAALTAANVSQVRRLGRPAPRPYDSGKEHRRPSPIHVKVSTDVSKNRRDTYAVLGVNRIIVFVELCEVIRVNLSRAS
jgi:hypothetical protein